MEITLKMFLLFLKELERYFLSFSRKRAELFKKCSAVHTFIRIISGKTENEFSQTLQNQ